VTAKRRAKLAGVASALWLLAAGASAQEPQGPPPGRGANGGGPQRMMPVEQRPGQLPPRDAATPGSMKRLSPEERRQLRRDVHDAGRDLYGGQMSPSHRQPRSP